MTESSNAHTPETTLEWFTHDILPNGRQICAIRNVTDLDATGIVLDESTTQLMHALLGELAMNNAIPFGQAKQAVLRAVLRAISPRQT